VLYVCTFCRSNCTFLLSKLWAEGLQYLSETIAGLKQKITSELIPHKIKDIIEDIHKLLQAVHKIFGHIEQDSALTKDALTKSSTDVQLLLKHFNLS